MRRTIHRLSPLFLILTFIYSSCSSQGSSGVTGVWCGVELTLSPMMGGGMDRTDVTLYLRPDGTFADEMDKPDWKTRVDGKYSVSGSTLRLLYDDAKQNREIKITGNKTMELGTGYVLRKMDTRKIPAGTYKFQYASGSGGGVSGTPYVGSSGEKNIYFDGKGNFHEDGYGGVVIAGDNIGGGSSRKDNASGTYTQDDATLTMNYASGKKETHSLFIGDDREGIMVVMNGDLFFRKSEKDITVKEVKSSGETLSNNTENGDEKNTSTTGKSAMNAADLAVKIKAKHGGDAIDKITTMRMSGKMNGLELTVFTDQQRGWSRTEIRQGGKLVGVEQLEGNKGWAWAGGKIQVLNAARIRELKDGLNTGFNVLHSSRLANLTSGSVNESDGNYVLTYKVNGTDFGMMVDPEFKVIGEGRKINGVMTTVLFSDFRQTNGLLVPFVEKLNDGKTTVTVTVTGVSINTVTDADWKEPS